MSLDRNIQMSQCYACYEKFSSQRELDQHLATRSFKCPFGCNESYVHQRELFAHEKVCAGKNKKTFGCYQTFNQ